MWNKIQLSSPCLILPSYLICSSLFTVLIVKTSLKNYYSSGFSGDQSTCCLVNPCLSVQTVSFQSRSSQSSSCTVIFALVIWLPPPA
jgi:hypothetical protein